VRKEQPPPRWDGALMKTNFLRLHTNTRMAQRAKSV
jgi:hypothetical protein